MRFVLGFALVLASTAFVVNRSGYEDAPANDPPAPPSSDGGDQQAYNSDGKQNEGGVGGIRGGLLGALGLVNTGGISIPVSVPICNNQIGEGNISKNNECNQKNDDAPAEEPAAPPPAADAGYGKKKLH